MKTTTEDKKNIEAARKMLKIGTQPRNYQSKYLRNSEEVYAVRVWFQKDEAKEVRSFLQAIRKVSTQFNSSKFIRDSVLKAVRDAKSEV